MATMKEALVRKGVQVSIVDAPIPAINDDQVLIRVVVSGSNPKDWKLPEWFGAEGSPGTNEGDDIAGVVERVGARVFEFKPGDRVAAFHEMRTRGGSYAEYAVAWQHTTFHIPKETSFEEAAAIPLAAATSALALYQRLRLPQPWDPPATPAPGPLVIYGAASAVGIYAVQLALRSGIQPIIAVAGRAKDYVASFLDPGRRGDLVIDYRDGDEAVVKALVDALQAHRRRSGPGPVYVLDAVSEGSSLPNLGAALRQVLGSSSSSSDGDAASGGSKVTFVLHTAEPKAAEVFPAGVERTITTVGDVHQDAKDFGYVYFRYMARGLQEGWFKPQRTEVVPGGLGGIETALRNLKEGKASAVKYVFRIAETAGVQG
ncbi:hypothetical protein VTJ83DRAFT_3284 [Remersonia thermophila]|uniref:Enoyl reductase (ER) domain-containing protein n=1 Tax=Remersonia thermophila TaxID=72144 RepID=A0ABR4DDK3_9PEZI